MRDKKQFEIQCNYCFSGSPGLGALCWESRTPFSDKKNEVHLERMTENVDGIGWGTTKLHFLL